MTNELKFYEIMKCGEVCKIGYVAYNDGIWVNYKDIGEYFGYGNRTYKLIYNKLHDEYKTLISIDIDNGFGVFNECKEKFIHISVILDLAQWNDAVSTNARNMVFDLERKTKLDGIESDEKIINDFIELVKNPDCEELQVKCRMKNEKELSPYRKYKRSHSKTTCPEWLRELI